ncbi:glycerophosphodiester phosphodiesterase family protein [Reichenbachiella sp. MALMAid0571]|uniref:glycerophosphodiester phosphodiesterase n=1 Tax=Reichenbachiella sp. MALMAid0571 TaxID=3143939 RepID=UPI0032DE8A74
MIRRIKKTKNGLLTALLFVLTSSYTSYAQNKLPIPKNGNTYVIAHRGVHNGIPENTLAAYQKAIDLGCDFVEIDVRTTKDNKFVSVHNSTIDAYVDNKTGKVRDFTLKELLKLDLGKKIGKEWKKARIPTFQQILKLCQGKIGIYLDLKDADPKALIDIIKRYKMEESTVWYLPASAGKLLMDIKTNCPKCLIMPDPGKEENIKQVLEIFDPKFLASDMGNISNSYIEQAHTSQIKVFVDDDEDNPDKWQEEWKTLIDMKVDGIQTDQPEALISFIKSMN